MNQLHLLSAVEAREALEDGSMTAVDLVESCFARIEELEDSIGAWIHLDKDAALRQAQAADDFRRRGLICGPLHGIPVGIKDIIDTSDYPTECGSSIYSGRTPYDDATLVALLREAGAIILGKTVTTELAVFSPGKTRNPHNIEHTPGGSSSGSAAAIACAMVPLTVGTQTNGSVIRPASFCGVYGFKPSFGRISRKGVLLQSAPLDTIGVFARNLNDMALIADVLMRYDSQDNVMKPVAPPAITKVMAESPAFAPRFAFVRTPKWDNVEESSKEGFRELIESANQGDDKDVIEIVDLPDFFEGIYLDHQMVMEADLALNYAKEYGDTGEKISDVLREMLERGQKVLATDYNAALKRMADYQECLDEIFDQYDAILTPSTFGAAPVSLDSTGNPAMNTIWTFCGNPAINVPLLQNDQGLPVGVQVVGSKGDDARVFRTTRWLLEHLDT